VYTQAQYWHDPLAEQTFVEKSLFLADINNQGDQLAIAEVNQQSGNQPTIKVVN
jgi:hypothetical protein